MKAGPFLAPLDRDPSAPWRLVNRRNGRTVASHILPAFDASSRRRGLLGRERLEDGHAMLIAPTSAVHTFFMHFPIDLAFLSREGVVLRSRAGVPPWRIAARPGAFCVLELPAGVLAGHDVLVGDQLVAGRG
jgi:uncharacterized membrane protein (UPF0127 family)